MSPHGIKIGSKKAKGVSLTSNGPRVSKKKRKLVNENSDPDVLDRTSKYWHGLKIDASDDIKEKLLKHLSSPSRRYKLKNEGLVLPAKKKRKLQKNGSLETDSDDEKNSKKCKQQIKKKYEESPTSSKFRKWKSELASLGGTKSKSKKLLSVSGEMCGKGKKSSRQKLLSSNYEDFDGVCIYELGTTPELKNKAWKKKLLSEKSKGDNHLMNMNKKKVKVGKGMLTAPGLGKKKKSKLRVNEANLKVLSKKQQNKLQKKYSLQIISDGDDGGTDSDHTTEKSISTSSLKKNLAKLSQANWMDMNKKKLKKHLQEFEIPKSKKSKRQVSDDDDEEEEEEEEDDEAEDNDEEYEEEEEESSSVDVSDDLEDDDDDDNEDSSEDRTSDDKSGFVLGLSNGDWEKVNEEEQIQQVTQDDDDDDDDDDVTTYGNGWKTHEGEKKQPSSSSSSTSSSTSLLHPWAQNNGISTRNTYHHESIISQQQPPHQLMQAGNMAAGCIPAQASSRPMINNSATLPQFGAVEDSTVTGQQHYPPQIQDSSSTQTRQQHFVDHQQQCSSTYNLYSGVDYGSQPPPSAAAASYNNDGKSTTPQSQNFHLQHHLLQSQTHSYSGFNHLQSQQNNSSSVQKVKHYYPAPIGKEGILEVEGALQPAPPEEVLTQGFRISIKRCDMATLVGSNWLNDEIINFYMNLIVQRGKTDGYSSVYIPSTFFFPMVMKRGYSGVRRWTKNVDIFDHDLMLIPIHLEMENHWTLIAVDFHQFSICYYDSYLQDKDEAMDAILDYLKEEMKAKKHIEMDTNCWAKVNMKNIPLQENLSDCGVFSCIYAEYISRGAQMDFTQEDMPYFRRKMVYEILHQNILNQSPRDTDNLISDDILDDVRPSVTELSNLAGGPVTSQYGLADGSQSPIPNENTMKVINEGNEGLKVNLKDDDDDDEEMSKDSDALESSSYAEQKMTNVCEEEEEDYDEDEETQRKRYSTQILSEIKQIVNVFEDANTREQKILLSHLRCILEAHSKKKGNKTIHKNLKELLLMSQRNSETEESEAVSSNVSSSETSGSSSESTSTEAGSNEEESKSSDQAEPSSQPGLLHQLKLNHVMWEVEKLMVSITDTVRSIGKACGLMSTNDRLLDPSGSLSVIKGIEFISSELKNISNHYNKMITTPAPPSPRQTTAVKKHVILSPNAVKKREGKILQYIASQLSVKHKNFPKLKKRKLLCSSKKKKMRGNAIPKKMLANQDEVFCNENRLDRGLLAHLIKDAGGRLLEERPCMRKFQFQKRLLNKLSLSDEISDLICPTSEKGHKHQAQKNLLRSDHGKKGKKKK